MEAVPSDAKWLSWPCNGSDNNMCRDPVQVPKEGYKTGLAMLGKLHCASELIATNLRAAVERKLLAHGAK